MVDFGQSGAFGGFLAAQQLRNEEMKTEVQRGQLGIQLQDLTQKRQRMLLDVAGNIATSLNANVEKLEAQLYKEAPFDPTPDLKFTQMVHGIAARMTQANKLLGMDDAMAAQAGREVEQRLFRAAAAPRQPIQAAAGTHILQVQPDGSFKTVAAVPPNPPAIIQSAQFAAPNNPTRQRELVESGMGGQARFSGQTPVFDSTGKQVAYVTMNDRTGTREYRDAMTGAVVEPKPDWTANTLSSQQAGQLSGKQLIDLQREVLEEGQGIDALVKMVGEARDAEQGFKLVANRFSGAVKTFFDQRKNDKEFQAAIQSGNLAQALGGLRVPLLGPGVMTQQDKEFLVQAVGGDVSALRDPDIMAYHVGNLIQRKAQLYALSREQLATQAARFPKLGIKVPDEKTVDPSLFERRAAPKAEEQAGNAPARAAPAVGTVRDGYRFKGGDPGLKQNWEKVK